MMIIINCDDEYDEHYKLYCCTWWSTNCDDDIGHQNMDGDDHNDIMLMISRTNHNLGTVNKNIVNIILG